MSTPPKGIPRLQPREEVNYEPGSRVTLSLPEGDVTAEVVVDHGGETVIVRYHHPRLDRDTGRIPVARALLAPAAGGDPPGPADDGSVT